jgi:hypothetical protein
LLLALLAQGACQHSTLLLLRPLQQRKRGHQPRPLQMHKQHQCQRLVRAPEACGACARLQQCLPAVLGLLLRRHPSLGACVLRLHALLRASSARFRCMCWGWRAGRHSLVLVTPTGEHSFGFIQCASECSSGTVHQGAYWCCCWCFAWTGETSMPVCAQNHFALCSLIKGA